MQTTYLIHHGIKGQKWGIRRYQNEDGSLTPEGEKRYEISSKKFVKIKNDMDALYNNYKNDPVEISKKQQIIKDNEKQMNKVINEIKHLKTLDKYGYRIEVDKNDIYRPMIIDAKTNKKVSSDESENWQDITYEIWNNPKIYDNIPEDDFYGPDFDDLFFCIQEVSMNVEKINEIKNGDYDRLRTYDKMIDTGHNYLMIVAKIIGDTYDDIVENHKAIKGKEQTEKLIKELTNIDILDLYKEHTIGYEYD